MKTVLAYFRHQLVANLRVLFTVSLAVLVLGVIIGLDTIDLGRGGQYYNEKYNTFVTVTDEYPYGYFYEFDAVYDKQTGETTYEKIMVVCDTPPEFRNMQVDFVYPFTVISILGVLVPVWLFAPFKKKRNLDCYCSLPINKREMNMVTYFSGLTFVSIPFILVYIEYVVLFCVADYWAYINHGALAVHLLVCLLYGWIVYTVCVFAFNEANSIVDGCIFIAFYAFLGYIVITAAHVSVSWMQSLISLGEGRLVGSSWFPDFAQDAFVWQYFWELNCDLTLVIENTPQCTLSSVWNTCYGDLKNYIWLIIISVPSVVMFTVTIVRFGKSRYEKTEGISDSVFGYKTLIPLYSFVSIASNTHLVKYRYINTGSYGQYAEAVPEIAFHPTVNFYSCIISFVFAAVMYTVYRRGFKYKASDYIIMGIILGLTVFAVIGGEI